MARNPSDSKRRLEQSRFEDEEQEEKKRRVETSPLATSSQLVQSIHAEWSASKDLKFLLHCIGTKFL